MLVTRGFSLRAWDPRTLRPLGPDGGALATAFGRRVFTGPVAAASA